MSGFMTVLKQCSGRLLRERNQVAVPYEAWPSSEAYRSIAQDRIVATEGPVVLVRAIR